MPRPMANTGTPQSAASGAMSVDRSSVADALSPEPSARIRLCRNVGPTRTRVNPVDTSPDQRDGETKADEVPPAGLVATGSDALVLQLVRATFVDTAALAGCSVDAAEAATF